MKCISPNMKLMNNSRIRVEFEESCLKKKKKKTCAPRDVVKFYFLSIYEIDRWSLDLTADFTLKDCLFGAVKLTKN